MTKRENQEYTLDSFSVCICVMFCLCSRDERSIVGDNICRPRHRRTRSNRGFVYASLCKVSIIFMSCWTCELFLYIIVLCIIFLLWKFSKMQISDFSIQCQPLSNGRVMRIYEIINSDLVTSLSLVSNTPLIWTQIDVCSIIFNQHCLTFIVQNCHYDAWRVCITTGNGNKFLLQQLLC